MHRKPFDAPQNPGMASWTTNSCLPSTHSQERGLKDAKHPLPSTEPKRTRIFWKNVPKHRRNCECCSLSLLIEITMKWMLWLLFSIGRNVVNFHKRPQVPSAMISKLWGQRDLRIPSSFVDSSRSWDRCKHLRNLMMCSFWPCTRAKVGDTIEISDTTLVALDLAIKIWLPSCSLMQQLDWPDRRTRATAA